MTLPSHRILAVFASAVTLTVFACDSGPAGPTPGALQAALVSPNGAEGAAVLDLSGPGIGAITPVDGQLFTNRTGGVVRVVIILDSPGVPELLVQLDDIRMPPVAEVIEVADGDNQLRAILDGYRVEFSQ